MVGRLSCLTGPVTPADGQMPVGIPAGLGREPVTDAPCLHFQQVSHGEFSKLVISALVATVQEVQPEVMGKASPPFPRAKKQDRKQLDRAVGAPQHETLPSTPGREIKDYK